ncbi:MAG: 2,4-dihydroxyhept-2-ene-1,7-dioic acid aldolase [Dehalococcoidia bacterium]|nr:2,4-dihydroxyhept-2-ene-1,7-dioic acid aldolase [Dehalococcoidia bacterium]
MRNNNVLRDLIDSGKPTIGTHLYGQWPGMVEVVGHSGTMDYIEFSGQYAPYDLFSLENFGRAIDLFDHMSSLMKLDQEPKTYLAERAIGSGIQNVLFADIRTVADAREAVTAVRPETPEDGGKGGASATRDTAYGYPGMTLQDYVDTLRSSVIAIMVEKKPCVDNLEEILSIGGIDMVQFGPGDFSMSIGKPGMTDDPEVKLAEKLTIETCLKLGIRPRAEINAWEDAKPYIDMGVIDFCINSDVGIMHAFCQEQGENMAKVLGR